MTIIQKYLALVFLLKEENSALIVLLCYCGRTQKVDVVKWVFLQNQYLTLWL